MLLQKLWRLLLEEGRFKRNWSEGKDNKIWVSQDSYEYPGEIVILKGFEEATTDEDNNEEGDEFKSNELIEVHNS